MSKTYLLVIGDPDIDPPNTVKYNDFAVAMNKASDILEKNQGKVDQVEVREMLMHGKDVWGKLGVLTYCEECHAKLTVCHNTLLSLMAIAKGGQAKIHRAKPTRSGEYQVALSCPGINMEVRLRQTIRSWNGVFAFEGYEGFVPYNPEAAKADVMLVVAMRGVDGAVCDFWLVKSNSRASLRQYYAEKYPKEAVRYRLYNPSY